ncbi:C-X-C motif chemokine 2-like [Numenius arquata]|uniref:C-X-C motif chemokine 2-like n=1 Tax=Numenius arquata TaxID=31919 RepID=UPI003D30ABE2
MQLLPAALALAMLLSNLVPGGGLSLESLLTNMRCKCIKSTAQVINLGLILAIDVTPPGIHCRRKEIILTLKKNKKVCVAPEAPWIQLLIHKLMQRNAIKKEAVVRVQREVERSAGRVGPWCQPPHQPPKPSLLLS